MNPHLEKRRALGHTRACFGGDSASTSTSVQNTVNTNIDNRSVVANDSHDTNTNSNNNFFSGWTGNGGDIAISNSGNTVSDSYNSYSTTMIDAGAVSGALAANRDNTSMVLALTQKLTEGTNSVLQKNQALTQELAGTTNAAYAGAAQQASGTNTFIFVAVGVVALAAILMRKA